MPQPVSLRSVLVTQTIAVVFFVGVPALITAIAPVSHITLTKEQQGISATVQANLLFVVPYSTRTVSPVTEITSRVIQGEAGTAAERRRGKQGKSEPEGQLIFIGPQQKAIANALPATLERDLARLQEFQKAPTETPLRMTVIAHWFIIIVVGGIATAFAVLYVVCAILGFGLWLVRKGSPGGSGTSQESLV